MVIRRWKNDFLYNIPLNNDINEKNQTKIYVRNFYWDEKKRCAENGWKEKIYQFK